MSNLSSIETDTLQAVKNVAGTYQMYQENFNDEKYREISTCFMEPLVQRVGSLLAAFEDINRTVNTLKNKGIVTEES